MMVLRAPACSGERNIAEQEKQRTKRNARVRVMWFPWPLNFRNTLDDLQWNRRVVRGLGNVLVSDYDVNHALGLFAGALRKGCPQRPSSNSQGWSLSPFSSLVPRKQHTHRHVEVRQLQPTVEEHARKCDEAPQAEANPSR